MEHKPTPKAVALIPILVFLILYLGLGLIFEYALRIPMGFYNIPIVVAFLVAVLVACLQNRAVSFNDKLALMAKGVGDPNIMTMILIFMAAGIFVGVTGRSSAEAAAYFLLNIAPAKLAVAVLFVVACFISMAMGTSVGTITLIAPIAVAVAADSGFSLPLCVASVVGGAMFGDNLSFISDTTIAACSTQGCEMKDKFRANFKIALPAALAALVIILLISIGTDVNAVPNGDHNLVLLIPYVLVLIGGIVGLNVFVVLLIGIVSGALITLLTGQVTAIELLGNMGSGVSGMFETVMVTILVSALCGLIRAYGGFESLLQFIRRCFKGNRGGQLGVGLLVGVMDIATAKQHRGHRHGRPYRQGDQRGIRHRAQARRLLAGHLLLHLPGHYPLRRTDAGGHLRLHHPGLHHLRFRDHPHAVLSLPAGSEQHLVHHLHQEEISSKKSHP